MKIKTAKDYLNEPYTFALIRDEDSGTFAVAVEEFEGCFSQGRTADEAMKNILIAAENWIEATVAAGKAIPPPKVMVDVSGKIALRLPKSLHSTVQDYARREDVSVNTFLIGAIAEKVGAVAYADRQMAKLEERMARRTVANLAAMLLPMLPTAPPQRAQTGDRNESAQKTIIVTVN